MPLPYNLDSITREHLIGLIDEQEGYSLEFKERVVFPKDKEGKGLSERQKDEFVADVTSLANELGGDLLVGVEEYRENGKTTGIAKAINGIDRAESDELDRQANAILQARTEPRLRVRTRAVEVDDGKVVLVIRVPRSPNAPHALKRVVGEEQELRFFGRNRTGKYSMNATQVGDRFRDSRTLEERITDHVERLLDRLPSTKSPPVMLKSNQLVALHVIPHATLRREGQIDARVVLADPTGFMPTNGGVNHKRMNLDGCLLPNAVEDGKVPGYVLVMHDGTVEFVATDAIRQQKMTSEGEIGFHLASVFSVRNYASVMAEFVTSATTALARHGLEPPYYVKVTVQDLQGGYILESLSEQRNRGPIAVDRSRIEIPAVPLEAVPTSKDASIVELRPIMESLMNAGGLVADYFYNEGTGTWNGSNGFI